MKQYEMGKRFAQRNIRYFVGDVRDPDRLHRAFNGVDIIIHAAALKIVPTAEYNPFEAVKTNVIGAENVINIAIDNKVKKVIALSTDKAANPINLYGATKLCAEKMFIAANNYSPEGTKFSVVRYGNVLGSRGSVVPYFMQCRREGVVPITHKEMTRFWVTLEMGVKFVLRSLKDMKEGEIFIPKLPSIKITDLAKAICPNCKQKVIGIRPGEKLHETLVPKDEWPFTYEYKDRFISYPAVIENGKIIKGGRKLDENFQGYRSDNNDCWLTTKELKRMLRSLTLD
jgi:UDP-N-acetylglucosamine 4,6-dehydratase